LPYIDLPPVFLTAEGKAGSLVDDRGHFYKPIQPGPRGDRERSFYESIHAAIKNDMSTWLENAWSTPKPQSPSLQAQPALHGKPTATTFSREGSSKLSPSPSPTTSERALPFLRSDTSAKDLAAFSLHRGPIEVLERDEVGLLFDGLAGGCGQHDDHEDDFHDDEDCVSKSPDSDDWTYMHHRKSPPTSLWDETFYSSPIQHRELYIGMRDGPPHFADYSSAEGAQAAALLGQPSFPGEWELTNDRTRALKEHDKSTDSLDEIFFSNNVKTKVEKLEKDAEDERTADRFVTQHSHHGSELEDGNPGGRTKPFTIRNAPLLRFIPRFYGVVEAEGRTLLELEDLTRWYRHPCIIDIKIGHRTWYAHADPGYIERCRLKDAATTQSSLGFKICGMQVFRHGRGGYWRASKRWCKTLPEVLVDKALASFAHNEHGLRPFDVYFGTLGVFAQLQELESWFERQVDFHFYSASLLILYEGDAANSAQARVRVRLVDFAHTFPATHYGSPGVRDDNFLSGLRSLMSRLLTVCNGDVMRDGLS
jgi:1D-myo-inositol-tetrakisphosphate 5-kinase/inositol-polyphosphate multikinase